MYWGVQSLKSPYLFFPLLTVCILGKRKEEYTKFQIFQFS
jgi:hypothetical protein